MTFQDIPDNTIFSFKYTSDNDEPVLIYAYIQNARIYELYSDDAADTESYEIIDLLLSQSSNFEIIAPFETPQQILAKTHPELFI